MDKPRFRGRKGPIASAAVLGAIVLGCAVIPFFLPPAEYMDLSAASAPPGPGRWFGTDAMGRDVFAMLWQGGRLSLWVGFLSAGFATFLGLAVGTASGLAPRWLDSLIMRLTEIFLSIPGLLLLVLIQGAMGRANVLSLSLTLGATGWTAMAKTVRAQVRLLRSSEYLTAARRMGAGPWRLLWRHLVPNVFPSILFMAVSSIRSAIAAESTLSFMGLGLPLEAVSWGSMLSLSENAMLSGAWWVIVVPGGFLAAVLVSITNIGNYLRRESTHGHSNL